MFDLTTKASADLKRSGQRVFKTHENFGQLVLNSMCGMTVPRAKNIVHPTTGTIGLARVVRTFVAISEQGGAKDSFVDSLEFTTVLDGKLDASIKINPVKESFRLVNASGNLHGSRTDTHKLKVSLAFPQSKLSSDALREKIGLTDKEALQDFNSRSSKAIKNLKKEIEEGRARFKALNVTPGGAPDQVKPYRISAAWLVRYNLCVADARIREDEFRILRQVAPEVYCVAYADTFARRMVDPRELDVLLKNRGFSGRWRG